MRWFMMFLVVESFWLAWVSSQKWSVLGKGERFVVLFLLALGVLFAGAP